MYECVYVSHQSPHQTKRVVDLPKTPLFTHALAQPIQLGKTRLPSGQTPQIADTRLLDDGGPILPIGSHLGEHVAHDLGAGHEAMLLALENADLALAHQLAEPAHVVDGDARVLAAVVDDDGAVDVLVAEADGVFGFEADDEVGGRVGVEGCAVPDGEGEALVEGALAVALGEREGF